MTDLDPGKFAPEWPGRLSGQITASSQPTAAGVTELLATLREVGGQLRGYPVQLAGQVRQLGSLIELREVQLNSGVNQLRASGTVNGTALALELDLNAKQLRELLPAASGQLQLSGQVTGADWQRARVAFDVSGRELVYDGQRVGQLNGKIAAGLAPTEPLSAQFTANQLALNGQKIERLQLDASGSVAKHQLALAVKLPTVQAQLTAAGEYATATGEYRGAVQSLRLTSQDAGSWQLQRPSAVQFIKGLIALENFCLREDKTRSDVCVTVKQPQADQFSFQLDSGRLALSYLKPWLPPALELTGAAQTKAKFTLRGGVLTGEASLNLPQAVAQVVAGDGKERLDFSTSQLTVRSDAKQLTAQVRLPVATVGTVRGEVRLPNVRLDGKADLTKQPLAGRVQLEGVDLRRVARYVPQVEQLRGQITADVTLGGTLGAPLPRGEVNLKQASFKLPGAGLSVTEFGLDLTSPSPQQLALAGQATIGGQPVKLTGTGRQSTSGWALDYRVTGSKLKLLDSKEYFARLSLDLNGAISAAGGKLSGQVRIPEARIQPRTLPAGTVSPAADVTVVKSKQRSGEKSAAGGFPFEVDVALVLGDAVNIEAFGLRGRLAGQLRVVKAATKGVVGDGQLEIVDGSYRLSSQLGVMAALGRPLTIDQGLLVFANTPLDDPGLVLSAQREGGDVTAGVRVLGTLRQPKLAFFSESDPNLTQAEITSYLITGIPPKRGAAAEDQTLSVGTYVAPKLFLEYENSLGDQADKVKLRYDYSKRVEIQTETGESQGADVFFKFEN
nr:translocation/assembly module TamB domain-containing protein [Thiospirillum jenense]